MKIEKGFPSFAFHLKDIHKYITDPGVHFVGRKRVKNKLLSALKHSRGDGGAFLVGGYRGVGKTCLVEGVVKELQQSEQEERKNSANAPYFSSEFKIDLGIDNDISTKEILYDVSEALHQKILRCYKSNILEKFIRGLGVLATVLCFLGLVFIQLDDANVYYYVIFPAALIFVSQMLNAIYFSENSKLYQSSSDLISAIRYSRAYEKEASLSGLYSSVKVKEIKKEEIISVRRIEQKIKMLLKLIADCDVFIYDEKGKFEGCGRIHPILIFDEVDKINSTTANIEETSNKTRKEKVDILLGGLKSLFTSSKATYIFIAGREMVDAYHSESGYTSVLYEGVFIEVFYVPTLLSDHSDGRNSELHSMIEQYVYKLLIWDRGDNFFEADKVIDIDGMMKALKIGGEGCDQSEKEENEFYVRFICRIFILYLTLHSWGNCKKLVMMIRDYLVENSRKNNSSYLEDYESDAKRNGMPFILIGEFKDDDYYLFFKPEDVRRFFVSAKLYTLFNGHMARQLSRMDDKLVVSSLITMLDVVKFHGQGFSRRMLDRTIAGIDTHAESNLTNVTDDILVTAYSTIVRRTSDNLYQYRFYLTSELEINYLIKSIGARASNFEFSLDSADPVRNFYIKEVERQCSAQGSNSKITIAKLQVILADIYMSERAYDKAFACFSNAVSKLKELLRYPDQKEWRKEAGFSLYGYYLLVQTLLKRGLLEEIREHNQGALRTYREAQLISEEYLLSGRSNSSLPLNENNWIKDVVTINGSGETLRHKNMELHAVLAADFLCLKIGISPREYVYKKKINPMKVEHRTLTKIIMLHFYAGEYEYVVDKFKPFVKKFLKVTYKDGLYNSSSNEEVDVFKDRNPFLSIYLYGQCLFSMAAKMFRNVQIVESNKNKDQDKIQDDMLIQWVDLIGSLSKIKTEEIDKGNYDKYINSLKFKASSLSSLAKDSEAAIVCSFQLLACAANGMMKRGFYSLAGQVYSAIFTNWIALLEYAPWQRIKLCYDKGGDVDKVKELSSLLEKRPEWLSVFLERGVKAVKKSDPGSFYGERQALFDGGKGFTSHSIDDVVGYVASGSKLPVELSSPAIWYRQNISCFNLVLSLWESYSRSSIRYWCGQDSCFNMEGLGRPVDAMPKVTAIFLWISARSKFIKAEKIISQYIKTIDVKKNYYPGVRLVAPGGPLKFIPNIDYFTKKFIEVIEVFSEALSQCKMVSRSGDPDTIPPKTSIYFNIYEVLDFYQKFYLRSVPGSVVGDDRDKLMSMIESKKNKAQSIFFDIEYIETQVNRYASDIWEIGNISSNSYMKKFRHKYYLYDDFADPVYIAEWSFLTMQSASAILQKNFVDRNVKERNKDK